MADEGESSTSLSQNCEDPPSKKARYSWPIQGNTSSKQENKSTRFEDLPKNCREASCSSHSQSESRLNVERLVTLSNYPVRKWQTRQLAKAVVDNTINKVIEDMGFLPFAPDLMDDIFPRNQRDEHVEDEAVLMAIQSHGLQQKDWMSCTSQSHSKFSQVAAETGLQQLKSWYEFENDENTNAVAANSWRRNESIPKQEGSSINNNSIMEPSPTPPSPSENKTMGNLEINADNVLEKNIFEHDFLAQAVAVAIQKKGLSTFLADESR